MTAFPRLAIVPPATDAATYLVRPFYPQGRDDNTSPKIAVATGFAASGGLALQTRAGLAAGDARAIVAAATANTASGPREWQVAEKAGLIFKKPSLLRAIGDASVPVTTMATDNLGIDDLSTDLILDEAFMAKAATLLGGDDLIAVIPKRGWLLVGRCAPGQLPVMMKFGQIARGIAERGGRHALTTNCYFIKGGALHGITDGSYISLLTNRTVHWNVE